LGLQNILIIDRAILSILLVLSIFYSYLIIFLTGMLGIWKAVPVGLALQCSPQSIIIFTSLGALLSILIIFFLGQKIKRWIESRMTAKRENRKQRLNKIFEKYGIVGMGILGTLLMGPNMTMVLGMIIVKNEKLLLLWTALGIVIWTIVLSLAGHFGLDFITDYF
jgi:membrane protein DedA with SNARE-associated domain